MSSNFMPILIRSVGRRILAEHLAIEEHEPALAIIEHDAVVHALHGIGEIVPHAGELALGFLALGDVENEALHRLDVAESTRMGARGPIPSARIRRHGARGIPARTGDRRRNPAEPSPRPSRGRRGGSAGCKSSIRPTRYLRRDAEQRPAALADEFHRPVAVVPER